jgi:hypothetical protein
LLRKRLFVCVVFHFLSVCSFLLDCLWFICLGCGLETSTINWLHRRALCRTPSLRAAASCLNIVVNARARAPVEVDATQSCLLSLLIARRPQTTTHRRHSESWVIHSRYMPANAHAALVFTCDMLTRSWCGSFLWTLAGREGSEVRRHPTHHVLQSRAPALAHGTSEARGRSDDRRARLLACLALMPVV